MEIERKYLIKELPKDLNTYPFHLIEQAYLNTDPVIRIRKQDEAYYMTYKGKGLLAREEYNLPLNETAYLHLLPKHDGNVISKKRYLIPITHPRFQESFCAPEGLTLVAVIISIITIAIIIAGLESTAPYFSLVLRVVTPF